ncbi:MAG: hypothetical protein AAFV07_21390, partial [Bacteroidota bacterium]
MNWKQLFIVSSIFWASLLVFTQCAQQTPKQEAPVEVSGTRLYKPTTCPTPLSGDPVCGEIKSQFAGYSSLGLWLNEAIDEGIDQDPGLTDSVIHIGDGQVNALELAAELIELRGFAFSYSEVKEIINGADPTEKVYLMFAVNNDSTSVKHRRKQPKPT